jgi:hypothetical protein
MIYVFGIVIALLTGGAIGLLLAAAHHQRVAAQRLRYEQEAARDRELHAAAAQAALRYRPTWPKN